MSEKTFHIHIKGRVQGVGFRPFVYLMAERSGVKGWVNNDVDGVHIVFNAEKEAGQAFYERLIRSAPGLAIITSHRMVETGYREFRSFEILHSQSSGKPQLLVTPDFGLCLDCRRELHTPADRRSGYPFITCTLCGPRYSIVEKLPYDRERTSMDDYQMCPVCLEEYNDPADRRYFSQTNSCSACGINLSVTGAEGPAQRQDELIDLAVAAILGGKIVAVKGIGGYLLCCDATDERVITLLRQRKARPTKPFALMYPDTAPLREDVFLRPEEENALTSPESPILLLDLRRDPGSGIAVNAIAPGLDQVGAMLPYAPLFELLLRRTGKPIVATSANVSNAPIIFEDMRAETELEGLADLILHHDRRIVTPQDDSVVRYARHSGTPVILRRSRGMAPSLLLHGLSLPGNSILAMGAELKSTFTLLHNSNIYCSQYLGDLESFDTQTHYRLTLEHLLGLFQARPEVVLTDAHPAYFATRLGAELAEDRKVPVVRIQHHKAHFGAILAEHNLLEQEGPVLGFVWDGTGLGDDGNIWGGESFLRQNGKVEHYGRLAYFDFILGDKMPREPRISALAATRGLHGAEAILRSKFADAEWRIYRQLLDGKPALKTSSVGRLFDAVASLTGVMDRASYEGEAAMRLEGLARRYFAKYGFDDLSPCEFSLPPQGNDWRSDHLLASIIQEISEGKSREMIAARFHLTLAEVIRQISRRSVTRKVCFSGGVFQNETLIDLIRYKMDGEFELYFHQKLSPNDENVSFGQLACYLGKFS